MTKNKKPNTLSPEVIEALGLTIQDYNQRQKVAEIIGNTMMIEPKKFKDQWIFFLKQFPKATITAFFNYSFQSLLLYLGFRLVWPLSYWECFGIWIILRAIRNGIYESSTTKNLSDRKEKVKW